MNVITSKVPAPLTGLYRYIEQPSSAFDNDCFDMEALKARGLLDGQAAAGRGNTAYLNLHDQHLVLRHFRRGGLARHISNTRYVFLGMERTRAFREFELLLHLQRVRLPAPRPYACQVLRHGLFYSASLVTYRLSGHTVAEGIQSEKKPARLGADSQNSSFTISDTYWRNIGDVIAAFHRAGVYHADLNAHNIMVSNDGKVSLIDFDRGKIRALPEKPALSGWCVDNIDRLERSVAKVVARLPDNSAGNRAYMEQFAVCKRQWAESVNKTF